MDAFVLGLAKDGDIPELYSFLFENPDANLRRRELSDLRAMVERRAFYICRQEQDGRLVGSCYLAAPEAGDEWELGGLFCDPAFRGRGIASALSATAVAYHYLMDGPAGSLIAHVLLSNPGPRRALESLGFVIRDAAERYRRDEIPGLEHMDADADGYVFADVYVLGPSGFRTALQRARVLITPNSAPPSFRVDLPFLTIGTLDGALADL
jgi:RimJ/RimL family protein N-acetyltransferase